MRAPRQRIQRRALHGVLLLDKPVGLSSNDALQKAKWLLRAEKAGHTGTLDPLASGLLPLCFGAATKFSQVSLDADKSYRATLHLGRSTSTGDAEGEILQDRPVDGLDRAAIDAACAAFTGTIDQVPPMHSALKVDGKALYKYARAGIEVERAPRRITIHSIAIVEWQAERLVIDVRCSKGTYIRTLAEDIGERLGCGAHLSALRRTASGALNLEHAITLEALAALDEGSAREQLLLSPDVLLADWPQIVLDASEAARFLTGLRRRVPAEPDRAAVRVYGPAPVRVPGGPEPTALLGMAHVAAGELIPDRLLSPIEVQALIGPNLEPAVAAAFAVQAPAGA
ncbi:tRNA pseudouridine(55) synthase TruB [Rivibacter subsaxonicus]|uniref:tRNA pseudouridine synthase B n=1 Tax=Rivibacter subsaxonicus TaxID=457575 RepID=A0A4Q7VDL9_9BURK|nr:tRNA pseudouridine(55) synthase TruB [Rivibacter subsaxonicus]RZT93850.1 tRNA pseudouridine synthase B [Rivibacter subsaxonicus]